MANYYGGSGNDALNAGSGNDVVTAYGGNDTVSSYGGDDTVYGGDGADSVFGGAGGDSLDGGGGNDTLKGDAGYDAMYGGGGDDRMVGASDIYDDFYGGAGNDTILAGDFDEDWAWGEAGNDQISMGGGSDLAWGGAGSDTVGGGSGNDKVQGGEGVDSISGDAGSDTVLGGAGNDSVYGGTEGDTVMGGAGRDVLFGGSGDDLLRGDSDSWDGFDASTGPINTTLAVTNSASFSVDLYWINEFAEPVFFATLAPGATWSGSTGSTHNWFLTETGSTTPVQVISGAVNQTLVFSPPFDDSLYGGDGNDTVFGDYGNDSVWGDAGNDNLTIGTGNDLVYGGLGNDTASLGAGNDSFGDWSNEFGDDSIDAGAGDDSVIAGVGNDTVFGGDGNDWLSGAGGEDRLYGGAGSDTFAITDDHEGDTIQGGESAGEADLIAFANWTSAQGVTVTYTGTEAGVYDFVGTTGAGSFTEVEAISATQYADTLDASAGAGNTYLVGLGGDDLIKGGTGQDTLHFGAGNDTVYGGAGDDRIDDVDGSVESGVNLIDAGDGQDMVWSGDGDDTVFGGAGDDKVYAEGGNDLVIGDKGDDALFGDEGDDTLRGGDGKDYLSGGKGLDQFQIVRADTGDVITDFDLGITDKITTDQLDVSELGNGAGAGVKVWDIKVEDDGAGNTILHFPEGESLTLQGVAAKEVMQPGMLHCMGVPCFAAGTRIATPQGWRAVQDIVVGDAVALAMGGSLPVVWRGQRSLTAADLCDHPALRPIRLRAGHWGAARDLLLSPQHAVAVGGSLIRARHLAEQGYGAKRAQGVRSVTYHHLLLPRHALILAEGVAVESLYPGPQTLAALLPADRSALRAALQGCGLGQGYGPRCLPLLPRSRVGAALQVPSAAH